LAAFSAYAALYVIVIFVPQLLEAVGLGSAAIVGLFLSAMNLAAFAVASVYGRIRRWLGPGVLLWLAGGLYVTSALILIVLSGSASIVVAMLTFGAAHGLVVPALTVSVGNCAPPPMRGRVTSGLGVTNYLGQFSSAYMAAPLVIIFGLAGSFVLLGLAGAIVAVAGSRAAESSKTQIGDET
jgi:MFS family permease